jgi:hypothetical protein
VLRRSILVLALAALIAPATAGAATVTKVNATTLRYDASPGIGEFLRITMPDAFTVRFTRESAADALVSDGCAAPVGRQIDCSSASITRIVVNLGDQDDTLNPVVFTAVLPIAMTIDGGPGVDGLDGSSQADLIKGGDGADFVNGHGGADEIGGGAGFDSVSFFGLGAVRVSLDGAANDGQGGGAEGANVGADVENVRGTDGNDVLIGSALANELEGEGGSDTLDGGPGLDAYGLGAGDDTAHARDGLGERIVCGEGADTVTGDDIDVLGGCETTDLSGELVRDLDHDAFARPQDCNDADPAIRPGATDSPNDGVDQDCDGADAVDLDRDGDGVPVPLDCDDGNKRIRPNARERYGNKVDEDCNGRADPLQSITTPVSARFVAAPGAARIARLQVLGARAGTRVQVRCRGDGCRFAKRSVRLKKRTAKLDLRKRFGLRRIGRQTLEVRLLRSDSIGRVVRFRGSGGGIPTTKLLCLTPGRKKPGRCG